MSADLQYCTIKRAAVVAIIITDNDGTERRIECTPPPDDVHLLQIVRGGGYISSDHAYWSKEDAERKRTELLTTARRHGALSVVTNR